MTIRSLVAPFTAFRTEDPGGVTPAPGGGEEPNPQESQTPPTYFDERFDPATLPPELQPAYQQMRNAFHQKTQGVAEERRTLRNPQSVAQAFASWSPEERQAFFEQAGLEYDAGDDDEEEDEEDDDELFYDPRVDVLIAEQQAQQRLRQQHEFRERQIDSVNDQLEALEKSTGREFSQEEVDLIGNLAMSMLDENHMPQVDEAYQRLAAVVSARQPKTTERRHVRPAPTGNPGEEELDLSNTDNRRKALAAEIEAAMTEEGQ